MTDHHKLQLAIYALLLKPKEDVLIIFKGEKRMGNNLTFKHRVDHRSYKDGEWDTVAKCDNRYTYITERNGSQYFEGPVVDRLHEFEKLGYEPEDLKRIIERHHEMNRYSRDAFDALWYAYKKAGDIENWLCDSVWDMWPSTLFTKEGFIKHYIESDEYRKSVTERIKGVMEKLTPIKDAVDKKILEVITRPVDYQKVWVTTSSSIKDDDFIKKVKEVAEKIDWPKKNPWLDFKHQFTATFNYQDTDSNPIAKIDKVEHTDEGIYITARPIRSGRYPWDIQKIIDKEKKDMFKIKRVIFNNPATIVFWADGDKTVVKCQNGEPYDPEKGLAMAISKKALGHGNKWYDEFKKHLKEYEEPKLEIKLEFDAEALHKFAKDAEEEFRKFGERFRKDRQI